MTMTRAEVAQRRERVAARLARAEAADPDTRDPIMHRLDEYRACIAELDAWLADPTAFVDPEQGCFDFAEAVAS
jgi:hypothetical protein